MNKISKKIVSLVTMAAFVLTLVPAAAFAATDVNVDASNYTVATDAAGNLKVQLNLQSGSGNASDFENNTVKITVTNTDSTTTVSGGNATTVSGLSETGVTPATYNDTFTFKNVPTGSHTVSVELTADNTAEPVAWTTLATTTSTAGAVDATNAKAPVVAVSNDADAEQSSFSVVKNGEAQSEANVSVGEGLTAKFSILDGYKVPVTGDAYGLENVKIWAVREGQTQPSSALTVTGVDGVTASPDGTAANVYAVSGKVVDGKQVTVSFKNDGIYTLYAGVLDTAESTDVKDATVLNGGTKITVDPQSVEVANVKVNIGSDFTVASDNKANVNAIQDGDVLKLVTDSDFLINGIQPAKLTVTAEQANGNPAGNANYTLRSSSPSNLVLEKTDVTTDPYGKFDIDFTIAKTDTYRIYVDGADVSFVIEINAENGDLDTITTTENNAQAMLAGTDKHFKDNVTAGNYLLDEAVQFEITDKSGNVVTNSALTGEPAAEVKAGNNHSNYLTVTVPENSDSTLTSDDLVLAWSELKKAYTLKYTGTYNEAKKDLVPGTYEVKVGLTSGATAKASFTLANYGTTQDMILSLTYGGNEVTDEVVLEASDATADTTELVAEAKLVDENGIKIKAGDDIQYGFVGQAVNTGKTEEAENNTGILKAENESLLGTVVKVLAFNTDTGKTVISELTVVNGYNEYTLEFEGDNGPVNENNKVTVKVVDEDGNLAKNIDGKLFAAVDSQSNTDAKVYVDAISDVVGGEGTLTVNSDKETTVKVAVMVKDNTDSSKSGGIYVGNLDYTIGGEDINAETTVVMTIGSTDVVVNNEFVAGDAAPYVDENWRTMVPVRVLGETFGGTVTYEDNVVTIVNGDTTVVMTIGEQTYTVNGEEKTMNTAPVIRDNDRAYVPVRFMAEALGYTVTPLQDANGLTASVVFQK